MDNLFSTHPSTTNRMAALADLAREMGVYFPAALLSGDDVSTTHMHGGGYGPWG
jgi:heat shock protein HtpX